MQQKFGRAGWLTGASLSTVLALFAVGAVSMAVTGCEEVENAVTCAALNNYRPGVNVSATGEASSGAFVITRAVTGSASIPAGIPVAGISIGEDDVSFSGSGNGTVRMLVAVDSVVVALATMNVSNGQITSVPGDLRLGNFDNATVSAMLNAVPVQLRGGLRLPTSSAEARTRTAAAVRSDSFDMTFVGQFTGDLNGTATLESIGFFCN